MLRLLLTTLIIGLTAQAHGRAGAAYSLDEIVTGLTNPLYLTAPAGDPRLFVLEQYSGPANTGKVLVFDRDGAFLGVFLDVPGVNLGSSEGLLGMAFAPDYASSGHFYVNYVTDVAELGGTRHSVVERYTVSADPNVADAGSARRIIAVAQPRGDHNGGWLGFGPDGYLYIALGDGGGANDPNNGSVGHGQDTTTLLGSILRIDVGVDVSGPAPYAVPADNPFTTGGGAPEIWLYGVRNPWRASFDRDNGTLIFADVGQDTFEEINIGIKEGNYGWRLREGPVATPTPPGNPVGGPLSPRVDPIHAYPRSDGRSITGGYVYRGPVAALRGRYLFGDFATGSIWTIETDGSGRALISDAVGFAGAVASFGEDASGNVYVIDYFAGRVLRFNPVAAAQVPATTTLALAILAPALLCAAAWRCRSG